ncbi:hypothetical protein BU16DRAFT_558988 [Lophium mytilinum]|uniref:GPI anchored cell wall protein n=1 Tax=Lophium mytilinum TaxID=390894 RepID=A0A6A6R324_9PEZI|nr:hypothetical protein BU16DRAFT_558988 [Lophium mytilinum]
MKTFTATALLATLLSTASAATVTLQTTQCLQSVDLETFTVTLGELYTQELKEVCGIKLLSASGTPLSAISCHAFKDAAGTGSGSALFNSTSPALIATNPVQVGSVLCVSTAATASGSLVPKSLGNATTPTGFVSSAFPIGTGVPSGLSTGVRNGTVTATLTRTPTVTKSGPTGTQSGSDVTSTGGAAVATLGFAAGLVGVVAMVL